MDTKNEAAMRAAIIAEAREWLGVRFVHRGRSRAGIDCVGLLLAVFNRVVQPYADVEAYPLRPTSGFAFSEIQKYAQRITAGEALPGDIVQMSIGGRSTHFGIITETGVIHAVRNVGRVVEHSLANGVPGGFVVAYYRLRGVPWA